MCVCIYIYKHTCILYFYFSFVYTKLKQRKDNDVLMQYTRWYISDGTQQVLTWNC